MSTTQSWGKSFQLAKILKTIASLKLTFKISLLLIKRAFVILEMFNFAKELMKWLAMTWLQNASTLNTKRTKDFRWYKILESIVTSNFFKKIHYLFSKNCIWRKLVIWTLVTWWAWYFHWQTYLHEFTEIPERLHIHTI